MTKRNVGLEIAQRAGISMRRAITIDARFCGPPDSANGGYVCGLIASAIEGPAEITLRAPPPLDTTLELVASDDGRVTLQHGATLLAEGKPAGFDLTLPAPVNVDEARDATTRYSGITFPRCFVCGSARADDGGLMIQPGALADRQIVAAPWTPSAELADHSGLVDRLFVWSALDCPSWFAHAAFTPPTELSFALLGRMSGEIRRRPHVGESCVVVGWPIRKDGRRIYSASALLDRDGNALAWSSATWIELKNG